MEIAKLEGTPAATGWTPKRYHQHRFTVAGASEYYAVTEMSRPPQTRTRSCPRPSALPDLRQAVGAKSTPGRRPARRWRTPCSYGPVDAAVTEASADREWVRSDECCTSATSAAGSQRSLLLFVACGAPPPPPRLRPGVGAGGPTVIHRGPHPEPLWPCGAKAPSSRISSPSFRASTPNATGSQLHRVVDCIAKRQLRRLVERLAVEV